MASIEGVRRYVDRALSEEKRCVYELRQVIVDLAAAHEEDRNPAAAMEMLTKLRNISRDVGWMRRLLADLVHEGSSK